MSGIVFLRCASLEEMREFYVDRIGMEVWLEQPDIAILRHGNMLIGFHETGQVDRDCLLTFVYDARDEVDDMYRRLKDLSTTEPRENERYRIYNFFAQDPEGRKMEFQVFLHPVNMPGR